jgi:RNA polymerase sigma-70 factor (ECF subfamily)
VEDLDRFTIERASRGDEKAFRRLYDHYAPFVWRIAYRSTRGERNVAEEIVQETFVRIHRSLKKFTADASLGTWIYRIAFNAANTLLAKQARQRETTVSFVDELRNSREATDDYETSELVKKILDELPLEDRFLLITREIDGLTFEEIAVIAGATPESLRTRMFRIRAKVKSMMDGKLKIQEAVV